MTAHGRYPSVLVSQPDKRPPTSLGHGASWPAPRHVTTPLSSSKKGRLGMWCVAEVPRVLPPCLLIAPGWVLGFSHTE